MGGLLSLEPMCPHAGPEGPGELVVVSGGTPGRAGGVRGGQPTPAVGRLAGRVPTSLAGGLLLCSSRSPPGAQGGVLSSGWGHITTAETQHLGMAGDIFLAGRGTSGQQGGSLLPAQSLGQPQTQLQVGRQISVILQQGFHGVSQPASQ